MKINAWYQIALLCGLFPLIFGIIIFISWFVTGAHWLELAGLINIVVGLCLFCIGIFFLGIYLYKAKQSNIDNYLKHSLIPLLILIINFPIAIVAINAATYIESISIVQIENHSEHNITNFRLMAGDERHKIGFIPKHGEAKDKFHFKHEGSVHYSFVMDEKNHEGIMFGYVTHGMGSTAIMVISDTGAVNVEEQF